MVARQAAFEAVPAEDYPRTRAAAATMATYITEAQFEDGLTALLRGVRPDG